MVVRLVGSRAVMRVLRERSDA
ncbi:MAG: hypothetical protein QOD88_396, partial [Mycobacterium sp.]|nr:hypothetical protein [Mycobacterium sp.]